MRLNLATRAARWSAAHWKTATFGWIAFVIAAVVIGGAIGTKQIGDGDSPGESGRMARILDEGFEEPAGESVLVQSDTLTVRSAAFASALGDVVDRVESTGVAVNVSDPRQPANAEQISEGRPLGRRDLRHPR